MVGTLGSPSSAPADSFGSRPYDVGHGAQPLGLPCSLQSPWEPQTRRGLGLEECPSCPMNMTPRYSNSSIHGWFRVGPSQRRNRGVPRNSLS